MRLRLASAGALALVVAVASAACAATGPSLTPSAGPEPSASVVSGGVLSVGPVFPDGLDDDHTCTASVIDSPTRDLVLTAAHCLSGDVSGWQVAPGYTLGTLPYGAWTVTAAYLPQAWLASQDPRFDYAILRVSKDARGGQEVGIEDVTAGLTLDFASPAGQQVTVTGYNAGSDDQALQCTAAASEGNGDDASDPTPYPLFACDGFVGGSSGSPWVLGDASAQNNGQVVGVIGGLHQGGCGSSTSYSSPFTWLVELLWARAVGGGPGDVAPAAGPDGC